jgi:tRNA-2-methylthio-N6-dimethylallyladenosine synthase
MNRGYTSADYLVKVKRLRDAVPDIAFTSDIIVGFPGETDDDFELTMKLLDEVRYDGIFSFKYSKRPGTAALDLSGHLPEEVKEARLARVLDAQQEISVRKNKEHVGTIKEILIDGRSKRGGKLTGRTRGNKAVNVAGPESLMGSLVFVLITSAGVNSFSGEIKATT